MLFAIVLEREPLQFPDAFVSWLQDVGVLAALAMTIWAVAYLIQRPPGVSRHWSLQSVLVAGFLSVALAAYVCFLVLLAIQGTETAAPDTTVEGSLPTTVYTPAQSFLLILGGICAPLAAAVPVVFGLSRLRWRRIYALARLSLKEALRRRVVWVFTVLFGLVLLFGTWFVSYKPEHQLRNYVLLVYFVLTLLFLLMAGLLGAFSIPADVKSQTIHTIVTKPVERFEIVLGRFLGYGALLTVLLFVLSAVGLIWVIRGITPEAAAESYKARVAVFPESVEYPGTESRVKGINVGREWAYRGYISGPDPKKPSKEYALFTFNSLPSSLANREGDVPCEFTFDIFRTNKGQEGKGISCTFIFVAGHYTPDEVEDVRKKRGEMQSKERALNLEQLGEKTIEKYGFYEEAGVDVIDYHTQSIKVPASFFRKVVSDHTGSGPVMKVFVNVNDVSRGQMVGMAKRDLYFLTGERAFEMNFFKGTFGLWCMMLLVLGLAVTASTYLSGIISFLCAMFLIVTGLFVDDIRLLAAGKSPGGGPSEATARLLTRKTLAAQLDDTPTKTVVEGVDAGFRSILRVVLLVIPDVNRYDLYPYVSSGFDISWAGVLFWENLLPLLGYLIPCALLAFYLMKFREVANPT
jgi:hypothetical protein